MAGEMTENKSRFTDEERVFLSEIHDAMIDGSITPNEVCEKVKKEFGWEWEPLKGWEDICKRSRKRRAREQK